MKYTWIWCLVNTILFILLLTIFSINDQTVVKQEQHINDMEIELQTVKECVNQKDTVVVNVNANTEVKVPTRLYIDLYNSNGADPN